MVRDDALGKLTQESFFRIVCGAVAGVDHDL